MATIDPDATLGDLVARAPDLAPVLDRLHLDYCCQGGRTLRAASAASHLDLDDVLAALGAVAPTRTAAPWTDTDPLELIDQLVGTHHRYLWDELPRLETLAARVVDVHGGRHPELATVAAIQRTLRDELEPHLLKEERVLFPMIRGLVLSGRRPPTADRSLQAPIRVMLSEHDRAGDLLAQLRRATDDYATPADACASYREWFRALEALELDTHLHIAAENHGLFPQVLALVDDHRVDTLAG